MILQHNKETRQRLYAQTRILQNVYHTSSSIGLHWRIGGLGLAELAAALGKSVLEEGGKEAGKAALRQLISKFDREKEPILFFSLFCRFKELPSFDLVSSEVNTILENTPLKGQEFELDKHTFRYWLSWDEFEGCEVPEDSWELDTYANPIEDKESLDWSLVSKCISDFTLWVFPLSYGNNKESTIVSVYRILARIKSELLDNQRLDIGKIAIFSYVRADTSMCSRIQKKLNDKLKEQKLEGNVYVETIANDRSLLTVSLQEQVYATALADSFKRWGI